MSSTSTSTSTPSAATNATTNVTSNTTANTSANTNSRQAQRRHHRHRGGNAGNHRGASGNHREASGNHRGASGAHRGPRFQRHHQNGRWRGGGGGGGDGSASEQQATPEDQQVPEAEPSSLQSAPAPAQESAAEDEEAEFCFICTEPIDTFAVAECNHRTCHSCSLRLRALYKTRNCAYCKTEQATVILTSSPDKPFQDYTDADTPFVDKKLDMRFETSQMKEDALILLRFNCPEPTCDVACKGWGDLKVHVKSVHEMLLCDLCIRHKKIFPLEHTLFTPDQLRRHRTQGFENNRDGDPSGFKGHPECAFCRMDFYGDDELYEHCRDKHEQCHVCVRQGIRHQYYPNYDALAKHFRNDHFMCQNSECLEKKFVVFASDIDLKAHEVEAHGGAHIPRSKQREARKVEVNFQYAGGPNNPRDYGRDRDRDRDRGRDRERDRHHDSGRGAASTQQSAVDAFPQLGTSVTSAMQDLNLSAGQQQQQQQGDQGGRGKSKQKQPRYVQTPPDSEASSSTAAAANNDPPPERERRGVAARAPAGFGALTSDTSTPASTPAPASARGVAARAPAGFGTLTVDTAEDVTSSPAAVAKPAAPADPETVKRHAALQKQILEYLGNDNERMQRFRQLTTAYRDIVLPVELYMDALVQLFSGNVVVTGKVVNGVIELLDKEEKKSELLRSWRDRKLILQSQVEHFPSLDGSSTANSYSALAAGSALNTSSAFPSLPSSPAKNAKSAPRVLVIKSSNTRHGGTRASSGRNVWDKVAAVASSPSRRDPSPGPSAPSKGSQVFFPTPQVGLSASGTAWATGGGTTMSRTGSSNGSSEVKRPAKQEEFPSLSKVSATVGRSGSQTDLPSWGARKEDNWEREEEEEVTGQKKGKKKQKKQVLLHLG